MAGSLILGFRIAAHVTTPDSTGDARPVACLAPSCTRSGPTRRSRTCPRPPRTAGSGDQRSGSGGAGHDGSDRQNGHTDSTASRHGPRPRPACTSCRWLVWGRAAGGAHEHAHVPCGMTRRSRGDATPRVTRTTIRTHRTAARTPPTTGLGCPAAAGWPTGCIRRCSTSIDPPGSDPRRRGMARPSPPAASVGTSSGDSCGTEPEGDPSPTRASSARSHDRQRRPDDGSSVDHHPHRTAGDRALTPSGPRPTLREKTRTGQTAREYRERTQLRGMQGRGCRPSELLDPPPLLAGRVRMPVDARTRPAASTYRGGADRGRGGAHWGAPPTTGRGGVSSSSSSRIVVGRLPAAGLVS
jgi:hypothetical protein